MANSCKIDNVWRGINKFFKKENGSWTEISSSPIKSYIMGKSLEYGGISALRLLTRRSVQVEAMPQTSM